MSNLVLMVDYRRKWRHFCFKGICWPKEIIEKSDFVCDSIVHRRRMVKSIYVIIHRFIKTICSEMLLKIGENTLRK